MEPIMSPLTLYLSQLIGLTLVLVGLSLFLRRDFYIETASAFIDDRPLLLILGMIRLVIGLAIVLAHNVWSGSAAAVIITLIGWIELIRGVLLLFLPTDRLEATLEAVQFEKFYYYYAIVPVLIGAYLTYAGFSATLF
jgi:hypothetical protein